MRRSHFVSQITQLMGIYSSMTGDVFGILQLASRRAMLVQLVLTAQYRPRCTVLSLNSSRAASVGAPYGHGRI